MRKVYRKILGFIIIICGIGYITGNASIFNFNDKDNLLNVTAANGKEKIL